MSGPVGTMPLFKKLRLAAGFRCLTTNAPAGFFPLLEDLPPGINFETELAEDGLLWVAFIKSSSKRKTDLTREKLWDIIHLHGFKAVTHVYLDQDWTAMRFRPLNLIGK